MSEMIDIDRVREIVFAAIERNAAREYPSANTRITAFMDSFSHKLNKELALIRKKTTQPLLDTIELTESQVNDIKGKE